MSRESEAAGVADGVMVSWCRWWVKGKAGGSLECWARAARATQGF